MCPRTIEEFLFDIGQNFIENEDEFSDEGLDEDD